jgi:hypothetical protein
MAELDLHSSLATALFPVQKKKAVLGQLFNYPGYSEREQCKSSNEKRDGALSVGFASSFSELCDAFRLVHERYVASGYMEPHRSQMRYSVFHLLPTMRVLTACIENTVVGTGYFVFDSEADLPSGGIFRREFDRLRVSGRIIGEAGGFACDPLTDGKNGMVNMRLIKSGFTWAASLGVDDLCMVVNPKHVSFYTKVLGLEEISEAKTCPYVQGADGILLRLDLQSLVQGKKEMTSMLRKVFAVMPEMNEPYYLSAEEAALLMLERPEILIEATALQRKILYELYPMSMHIVKTRQRANEQLGSPDMK